MERRDVPEHIIVIEEVQNVLKRDQEESSIITTTYRDIRSLCEEIYQGCICEEKGAEIRQKIYFLFPYGEKAYRQKFGEYPDIGRARRKRKNITHEEMKRKVMGLLGIKDCKFGRFDIIAEDDPIEIETGSNRND